MLDGEDRPFNCDGGSICRSMGGDETDGPGTTAAVGLWTLSVPGLEVVVGPLPDPELEVVDNPVLFMSPCVCWGGCC
jgi:hypothetical protein